MVIKKGESIIDKEFILFIIELKYFWRINKDKISRKVAKTTTIKVINNLILDFLLRAIKILLNKAKEEL